MYVGNILSLLGLALLIDSVASAALFLLCTSLQIGRALYEEKLLKATFPTYVDYSNRVGQFAPKLASIKGSLGVMFVVCALYCPPTTHRARALETIDPRPHCSRTAVKLRNVCLLNIAPDLTDLERYPVTQIATSKTTVGKKCDQWFRKAISRGWFTASDYDGLEFKTDTEMIGAIGSDPECRQFAGLQDQCRSVTDNDGLSPEAYLNRLEATKGCLAIVGFKTVCKALEKVAKSGILLSESRRSVMSECFVTELLERRIEFLRPLI
jgi:hypothetical protein